MIYIDGQKVPVYKALEIMTYDFIDDGQHSDQTVIDLRDALKKYYHKGFIKFITGIVIGLALSIPAYIIINPFLQ